MMTTQKLTESSWLAQSLSDMIVECKDSSTAACLDTLKYAVNLADNENYQQVYRENKSGKLYIVIMRIPPEMRNGLCGLAARYSEGANVLTTHDLNSATLCISDIMDQIRSGA